jgi:BarA-like signal transduction histidine kinase
MRGVFNVLAQLKQALTAVQHMVVAVPSGGMVSLRQLMQQHAAAELQQQKAGANAIAAATVLSLVQVL